MRIRGPSVWHYQGLSEMTRGLKIADMVAALGISLRPYMTAVVTIAVERLPPPLLSGLRPMPARFAIMSCAMLLNWIAPPDAD